LTIAAVADTHAALWHLFDDARLSAPAGAVIAEAATASHFDYKVQKSCI
jgi:PIN domain nuclease of toxin-antitoxin system